MSPAIEAAWIAAGVSVLSLGGTVLVALAGFRNTATSTTRAIEAGTANTVRALNAARDDRLWEKRAACYEETVTYLLYVQISRRRQIAGYRLSEEGDKALGDRLDSYKHDNWFGLQARLALYASDSVAAAVTDTDKADRDVARLRSRYLLIEEQLAQAAARDQSGDVLSTNDRARAIVDAALLGADLDEARAAVDIALLTAEARDREAIKLFRAELPDRTSQPAVLPSSG